MMMMGDADRRRNRVNNERGLMSSDGRFEVC